MRFKHPAWIPVAWILSAINAAAVWVAAVPAEPAHATIHAVLAVLFAVGAQHLRHRRVVVAGAEMIDRLRDLEARLADPDGVDDVSGRLAELEERVDFAERAVVDARSREPFPPKG